ncbi:MAG: hypothetical protein AAF806_03960 [Bacteroidota bacterium]
MKNKFFILFSGYGARRFHLVTFFEKDSIDDQDFVSFRLEGHRIPLNESGGFDAHLI